MLDELQHNRELWKRQSPAVFRYVLDPSCNCPPQSDEPYVVLQDLGEVTAQFESRPGSIENPGDIVPPNVLSINATFELLARGIDEAADVQVTYDDFYGYPTDVMIHWSQTSADDSWGFQIHDFELIHE